MIPFAPKPASPSPAAANDDGVIRRTNPAPATPYVAVVPGLATTHFAPWIVVYGRVSVANPFDLSIVMARIPGTFAVGMMSRMEDARECPIAPASFVGMVSI